MKVLVTGAKGFVGKNLCLELENQQFQVFRFDKDNTALELTKFVNDADFIVHLAGINRPLTKKEFYDGNANSTLSLVETIKKAGKKLPLIFSSSIQVSLDNDYGKSKKMAEDYLTKYSKETGNTVYIYHLSNVFGKWCRPNYNSVIATFCYNVSHNLEIKVSNSENEIPLVYIDDVVKEFIEVIAGKKSIVSSFSLEVEPVYKVKLSKIVELITSFKNSRVNLMVPSLTGFEAKLYSTYVSYLDPEDFSYSLVKHEDSRGAFIEFLKSTDAGQIAVNTAKPGITKGNHWHHSKTEKFLVVSGEASIKLRKIDSETVKEYIVKGIDLKVVDIPPGYVHNITNLGKEDLVFLIWTSELFDPKKPDTYFKEVE